MNIIFVLGIEHFFSTNQILAMTTNENLPEQEVQQNNSEIQENASNLDSNNQNASDTQQATPTNNNHQNFPEITEQDIAAILDKNIPANPTFQDDNPQQVNTTDSIIDELASVADALTLQNEQVEREKMEAISQVETLTKDLEEARSIASQVDDLFKDIASQIPVLSEYAEAKVKGEEYEIPLQYIPENFKRVEEHPIV